METVWKEFLRVQMCQLDEMVQEISAHQFDTLTFIALLFLAITFSRYVLYKLSFGMWYWIEWASISFIYVGLILVAYFNH